MSPCAQATTIYTDGEDFTLVEDEVKRTTEVQAEVHALKGECKYLKGEYEVLQYQHDELVANQETCETELIKAHEKREKELIETSAAREKELRQRIETLEKEQKEMATKSKVFVLQQNAQLKPDLTMNRSYTTSCATAMRARRSSRRPWLKPTPPPTRLSATRRRLVKSTRRRPQPSKTTFTISRKLGANWQRSVKSSTANPRNSTLRPLASTRLCVCARTACRLARMLSLLVRSALCARRVSWS